MPIEALTRAFFICPQPLSEQRVDLADYNKKFIDLVSFLVKGIATILSLCLFFSLIPLYSDGLSHYMYNKYGIAYFVLKEATSRSFKIMMSFCP